jgi:DNA-binding transcriptional ArsR family regulator
MADIFKALAHPVRRSIIEILREGPRSSGEIAGAFDASWPTITAHLQALKEAGLISAQRTGGTVTYRLDVSVMEEAATALMALLRVGAREKPK